MEFFITYRESSECFDPLPFVEKAFKSLDKDFDSAVEHDPLLIIERYFTALILSHAKILREIKQLDKTAQIEGSETFIGKFVSSRIYTQTTCNECLYTDWIVHEEQTITVPGKVSPDPAIPIIEKEDKYSLMVVDNRDCFVPNYRKLV